MPLRFQAQLLLGGEDGVLDPGDVEGRCDLGQLLHHLGEGEGVVGRGVMVGVPVLVPQPS